MADKAWKQCERRVARLLGGQRVGPSGRNTPDVLSDLAAAEVKMHALPAWLREGMRQAQANAPTDRLPLLVLHHPRQPYEDALVVLTVADFAAWFIGNSQAEEGPTPATGG